MTHHGYVPDPHTSDIQSCWVDPIPERDTMVKFEGKNVAEQIARYEDRDTQ